MSRDATERGAAIRRAQDSVATADRLRPLLEDPAVRRLLAEEERRHVDMALTATSDPDRLSALADARAVRALAMRLAAIVQAGTRDAERLEKLMESSNA